MSRLVAAAALSLALSALTAAPARAAEPDMRTYIVQPGDSVWSIAEAFYGSGGDYKIIYRYNKFVGRPPFLLKPGQVLRLPVGKVFPEAQVSWLKREVQAKPPRSVDWLDAHENMNLWKLYKVATGDDSAAHLVFEDESDLRLRDNALLVIYGSSAKATVKAKREKTRVVLEHGTIRGGLATLDGDPQPMRVETPSGVVDLLAKMVQVEAAAKASAVSVYEGKASVQAAGKAVEVPTGYGTTVEKGKAPKPPKPLPPAPAWATDGLTEVLVAAPSGQLASYKASWRPVAGVARYRVELARDAAFSQTFIDVEVDASIQQAFLLKDVAPGTYYARVAGITAERLEGSPSPALAVTVVEVKSARRLEATPDGGFEVVGFTQLTPDGDAGELEWAVGDGPFASAKEPLTITIPGQHIVRLRRVGAAHSSELALTVRAVTATLVLPPGPVLPGELPVPIEVRLVSEGGLPAALPGLQLTSGLGGTVALTPGGAGAYTASVPVPPGVDADRIPLRLSWMGGTLAEGVVNLAVPERVEPEPERDYRWESLEVATDWDRRTDLTAAPTLLPATRLGLHGRVVSDAERTTLGVAVVGELALDDERLGLDADLTFLRPQLSSAAGATDGGVGDLVLGARYRLIGGSGFDIAPSLRFRVPLGKRASAPRLAGAEPGVILGAELGRALSLETRQGAMIATGFASDDLHVTYGGSYAAFVRPADWLGLALALDTTLGVVHPDGEADSGFGLAAGGGLYLFLDRVRVGLTVGLGLNDAAREALGDVSGALTLDLGYGGDDKETH